MNTEVMTGLGIDVGRLFGIRIRLDWSLIIIFVLVAANLGGFVFPAWHPEWSLALTWVVALAAASLFFASILVHELSHALAARAYDIRVSSITLFLFGGIANIEEDPESPKAEALIAGIGPVVSIGLGVSFLVVGGMLAQFPAAAADEPLAALQRMSPVTTLLAWLGPVNILVGVFNLLPGFPLDGGRVLRAVLWSTTGNLYQATRWASRIGQAFAWLLIATGIAMALGISVPVLGSGLLSGMWLVFIGWFLNWAAVTSYRQLVIRQALQGVPIARLMRRPLPPSIERHQAVSNLVDQYMARGRDEERLVVDENGWLVGLVHAKAARAVPHPRWDSTTVDEIALPLRSLPLVQFDHDAFDALKQLGPGDRSLLVFHDDRLVGVVHAEDVGRWLELYAEELDASKGAGLFRPRSSSA